MIRTRSIRFGIAAGIACASLLTIVGCASEPPGQSQAEACQLVSAKLTSLSSDVSEGLASMTAGDISAAQSTYSKLSATLDALTGELENKHVKDAVADVQDSIDSMSSAVALLSADGALGDPATVAKATTAGDAAITKLTESGDALNKLCATT